MLHKKSVENVMKSFLDIFNDGDYVFVGFVELSESNKVEEINKKLIEKEKYRELIKETIEGKYQIFDMEGITTRYPVINLLEVK